MNYTRQKGNVRESKQLENLSAENVRMKDMLSYVALMSDIEIPEENSDVQSVEENA